MSIVVETSNLTKAGLRSLGRCLASLDAQTVPVADAHEVIVLEGGEAPARRSPERVCAPHPWATIRSVDAGTRYGDVKALAGDHVTGDLVVLCDADVRYGPDWLERLLEPFELDHVQIASGETTTPVRGPYSLAIALTFVFPRFTEETEIAPALWYWANNVAARRTFLEAQPLPQNLPIYRGQTIVHGKALRVAGHTIWRVPGARAIHDVPSLGELLPRFVLKGYDSLAIARLVGDPTGRSYMGGMEPRSDDEGRMGNLRRRFASVFAEDRRRLVMLPVALPFAALILAAYGAGRLRAHLRLAPREARARFPPEPSARGASLAHDREEAPRVQQGPEGVPGRDAQRAPHRRCERPARARHEQHPRLAEKHRRRSRPAGPRRGRGAWRRTARTPRAASAHRGTFAAHGRA